MSDTWMTLKSNKFRMAEFGITWFSEARCENISLKMTGMPRAAAWLLHHTMWSS